MHTDDLICDPERGEASTPLEGLAPLAERALSLKALIREKETELAELKARLESTSAELLKVMDLMDLESFRASGHTFFPDHKTSVRVPKDPESKLKLFEYLQELGIYLDTVSVNSQTLNSLYKSLAESAEAQGIHEFSMPGVEAPSVYTTLKIRKL